MTLKAILIIIRTILLIVVFSLVKPTPTCKIVAVFVLIALMMVCYLEGANDL